MSRLTLFIIVAALRLVPLAAEGLFPLASASEAEGKRLITILDCTKEYGADRYFALGDVRVVHSPAGNYREAGPSPDSRFGYRFAVEHIGRPHLAVIRYPDDKTRCMSVSDGTCYDLSVGVFTGKATPHGKYTGLAQPISGKMLEIRQYFWPRWTDCSIVFGNTTQGQPVAAASVTVVVRLANPTGKTVNLSTNAQTDTADHWLLTLGPYELQSFALSPEVNIAGFAASSPLEIVTQLIQNTQTTSRFFKTIERDMYPQTRRGTRHEVSACVRCCVVGHRDGR